MHAAIIKATSRRNEKSNLDTCQDVFFVPECLASKYC